MELSTKDRETLETLYRTWGLDQVRKELARAERNKFADPEVTAFARAWIAAEEDAFRRKKSVATTIAFVGIVLLGVAAGIFLNA